MNSVRRVAYVRTDLAIMQSAEPGGSTSHTEGVVRGLIDCNIEVICATPRPVDTGSARPASDWLHVPYVRHPNVHTELVRALSDQSNEAVLSKLTRESIDAIYSRYALFNTSALGIAQELGIPFILEFNCSEADFFADEDGLRFARLGRQVERGICEAASLVVVVSDRVAEEVARIAPKARVLVSPNGVDVNAFEVSESERQTLRGSLGVERDEVVIGFVGRFYGWHGVSSLAESASSFLKERPESRLLLVGDGPHREQCLRKLSPFGERVISPGIVPHPEIAGYLAASDILASPHAAVEGFVGSPMKIFEYLASGRAIVASRLEQIGEVLSDEETALLVTPGNTSDLTNAITRLIDDPQLRARLGQNAGQEARERHGWRVRMEAVLSEIS